MTFQSTPAFAPPPRHPNQPQLPSLDTAQPQHLRGTIDSIDAPGPGAKICIAWDDWYPLGILFVKSIMGWYILECEGCHAPLVACFRSSPKTCSFVGTHSIGPLVNFAVVTPSPPVQESIQLSTRLGKLTWLAGKSPFWRCFESMYSLLKMGDFSLLC